MIPAREETTNSSYKYSVRVVHAGNDLIVNICDEELLGMVFKEDNKVLDVSKDFYGGELFDENGVVTLIREASILTLVGERAVSIAIREGLIHPESVLRIRGVPYAMFFKMRI